MPFGLCNAPATFQRCMSAIFHGFCEDIVEVFMDDFSVYGTSFDDRLHNLIKFCRDVRKQIWCSIGRSATSWLTKGSFLVTRFPRGELKRTRGILKLLKGCHIQGTSKVFVVSSVMLVSIEDLLKNF